MKQIASIVGLYIIAAPFGYLLNLADVPLAWMIGPMLATAVLFGTERVTQRIPTNTRPFGQIVVATFVGAHFSPETLLAFWQTAPVVLGLCLLILLSALFVAYLQIRVFQSDPVTAVLSVVPTSPVEAAVLAEEHDVSPTPIIFTQTIRTVIVVLVVPLIFFAIYGAVSNTSLPPTIETQDQGSLWIMITGAVSGIALFKLLKFHNPYFLGPLLTSSILAAIGQQSYTMPLEILFLAQLILGTWLGSCLRPELWRSGNRVITAGIASSALLLVFCCSGAYLISLIVDIPATTLILGAAPGGVTEMALTAGVLGLDVAFVTLIHIARIFIIMPNLNRIVRLLR